VPRIFISHSRHNNAEALAIKDWLEANGWVDPFLDIDPETGMVSGERWRARLNEEANICEAVLILLSPEWAASKWCLAEFIAAQQAGKRIFGAFVSPVPFEDLPSELVTDWQLVSLLEGEERECFTVAPPPERTPTEVSFAAEGLRALRRGMIEAGLSTDHFRWPPEGKPNAGPYPGFRALEEDEAGIFFGRDAEIIRALDALRRLREEQTRSLFVIQGASGAGKSSFLRAGLVARLKREDRHFVVLPTYRPADDPAAHFVEVLHQALGEVGLGLERAHLKDALKSDPETLANLLGRIREARRWGGVDGSETEAQQTLILPIDQAEELFFGAPGAGDVQRTLADLVRLVPRFQIVMAIRSDAYPLVQHNAAFKPLGRDLFDLSPMRPEAYRDVILRPAERMTGARQLRIDPALVEQLLDELRSDTGGDGLPLLAFTLERLYHDYGTSGLLNLEAYQRLGGIEGILQEAIHEALVRANTGRAHSDLYTEQDLKGLVIPWLARIDPHSRLPIRSRARQCQIPEDKRPLAEALVEERLLTKTVDTQDTGESVYEPAHEALLRRWHTLCTWLAQEAEDLIALEALNRDAQAWGDAGRPKDLLLHKGERLDTAKALQRRDGYAEVIAPVVAPYLDACRQQQCESARTKKVATAALWGGMAAVVTLLIGFAVVQYNLARDLATRESLNFAVQSETALKDGNADRAYLLALEGLPVGSGFLVPRETQRARDATYSALYSQDFQRVRAVLEGHGHDVRSAAFSPDGTKVVTASDDKTARVWDLTQCQSDTCRYTVLEGHKNRVTSAAFSGDGTKVVTASGDTTARVWDLTQCQKHACPSIMLEGHESLVSSAAFSPDGTKVVTASNDATARVWDLMQCKAETCPSTVLRGHQHWVRTAAFSPDGTKVVTASGDTTARVWDLTQCQRETCPLIVLKGHGRDVYTAEFSPDGTKVVTASGDTTARVWDLTQCQKETCPSIVLKGHESFVSSAVFSPDGTKVVTASWDNTARVWDLTQCKHEICPSSVLNGHEDVVNTAAFSPDGRKVVTASDDKTARVWDLTRCTLQSCRSIDFRGQKADVNSAAFSADGTKVVTASGDRAARVWDVSQCTAEGCPAITLRGHEDTVNIAAFSHDGTQVVTASGDASTASADNTARVWDLTQCTDEGCPSTVLKGHGDDVNTAAFSHDGTKVVTASDDNTARVWDLTRCQEEYCPSTVLKGHENRVLSATFSPNGTKVVTASRDNTARVWDLTRCQEGNCRSIVLKGHGDDVYTAAFSLDGNKVVTASWDNTARVWDLGRCKDDGCPAKLLKGHEFMVESATFSPDGNKAVTASADWTARVWDLTQCQEDFCPSTVLKGHEDWVRSAEFSPDGTKVVTASWDNTARIWDLTQCKDEICPSSVLKGHDSAVEAAAFSPQGTRVVTASIDRTARVWQVIEEEKLCDRGPSFRAKHICDRHGLLSPRYYLGLLGIDW